MSPSAGHRDQVHLPPGHLLTIDRPAMVSTILGAAVAVCLWDAISRTAGIAHFVVPFGKGPRCASDALVALLDEMTGRGASVSHLVAKVFGGACVSQEHRALAAENIDAARRFLALHEIPVTSYQTGGTCDRRVLFDCGTGFVYVKEI